jgi:hypothetical protein
MRRLVLSLVVILAGLTPAFAFDTPEALLKALYAPYANGDSFDWSKWDETPFRSKALNELFARDAKEANGDVGRLDFDPYIDGQDYVLTDLQIGTPAINGDKAAVDVTFKNMDTPDELMFTLVKEADGWKIDDVVRSGKDFPYSLKAIMSGPLPG